MEPGPEFHPIYTPREVALWPLRCSVDLGSGWNRSEFVISPISDPLRPLRAVRGRESRPPRSMRASPPGVDGPATAGVAGQASSSTTTVGQQQARALEQHGKPPPPAYLDDAVCAPPGFDLAEHAYILSVRPLAIVADAQLPSVALGALFTDADAAAAEAHRRPVEPDPAAFPRGEPAEGAAGTPAGAGAADSGSRAVDSEDRRPVEHAAAVLSELQDGSPAVPDAVPEGCAGRRAGGSGRRTPRGPGDRRVGGVHRRLVRPRQGWGGRRGAHEGRKRREDHGDRGPLRPFRCPSGRTRRSGTRSGSSS